MKQSGPQRSRQSTRKKIKKSLGPDFLDPSNLGLHGGKTHDDVRCDICNDSLPVNSKKDCISCRRCPTQAHANCIRAQLKVKYIKSLWLCLNCRHCSECDESGIDQSELIFCRTCDASFHYECIRSISSACGKWICGQCKKPQLPISRYHGNRNYRQAPKTSDSPDSPSDEKLMEMAAPSPPTPSTSKPGSMKKELREVFDEQVESPRPKPISRRERVVFDDQEESPRSKPICRQNRFRLYRPKDIQDILTKYSPSSSAPSASKSSPDHDKKYLATESTVVKFDSGNKEESYDDPMCSEHEDEDDEEPEEDEERVKGALEPKDKQSEKSEGKDKEKDEEEEKARDEVKEKTIDAVPSNDDNHSLHEDGIDTDPTSISVHKTNGSAAKASLLLSNNNATRDIEIKEEIKPISSSISSILETSSKNGEKSMETSHQGELTEETTQMLKDSNGAKRLKSILFERACKAESLLPAETSVWTVEDVYDFIRFIGFPDAANNFLDNQIDGKSLLLLSRKDVLTGFKLKLGPALKIYAHIFRLQRKRPSLLLED